MDIYLDCEWRRNGIIFLVGFAYDEKKCHLLYGKRLNKRAFKATLNKAGRTGGAVYFYGPDIGFLERFFKIDIRNKYKCVNLLTAFRHIIPPQKNYKLATLEKKYGIKRKVDHYKKDITRVYEDFINPKHRQRVIIYNMEDVINLVKLKQIICKRHKITRAQLLQYRLK